MDELIFLRDYTGGQWTGVGLSGTPEARYFNRPTRPCEAVSASFAGKVVLRSEFISCYGAKRSFAIDCSDELLTGKIAEKSGIPDNVAREIINGRPRLEKAVDELSFGAIDEPAAMIGYLEPASVMKLLRLWQACFGGNLHAEVSGFIAVCSCIAAAVRLGEVCISFGCPDSRQYGGIEPDRLVAVIPAGLAGDLKNRSARYADL